MDFNDLWNLLASIPAEVALPALAVFAVVAMLRVVGLVKDGDQARLAVAAVTFLAEGTNANSLDEATVVAGIAFFAALYHWAWEKALQPLIAKMFASVTKQS